MTSPPLQDLSPIPFGVHAETGEYLPGLTEAAIDCLARREDQRSKEQQNNRPELNRARALAAHLGLAEGYNASNLDEAGWGVIFPASMQEQDVALVRQALEPLLKLRKSQAGPLYKEFSGDNGYKSDLRAREWLEGLGSGLASVDPAQGVPYYMLLVGSPQDIPLTFQFDLDTFFAVGRLYFNHVDEYATYAQNMVTQESAATVPHDKSIALVATRNPGDRATALFHDNVAKSFCGNGDGTTALGQPMGYSLHKALAADATKSNILKILHGDSEAKKPAMLISGSHGVAFNSTDAGIRDKQGAILTQDWGGSPSPVAPSTYLTGDEIECTGGTPGMIHFFFACYSAACPTNDTYSYDDNLQPVAIAPQSFVSRLPQKELLNGAQAVIGHVDRVWANSFQNGLHLPMVQKLRDPILRLLQGRRVGDAMDGVNQQWGNLAAVLDNLLQQRKAVKDIVSSTKLAAAFLERDDARNYIVLGDPAARIRLE